MNQFTKVAMSAVVLVVLGGCQAEERKAPKRPVVPLQLEHFPLGSELQGDQNTQTFLNNKAFLWPAPLHPNVSEMVLRAAKQVDTNEDEAIVARARMTGINDRMTVASDQLSAAMDGLADELTSALNNLRDLGDELATTYTDSQFDDDVAKTEAAIEKAERRLARAAQGMASDAIERLVRIGQLMLERARLSFEEEERRQSLAREVDALNAALPAPLPLEVDKAKSERDGLFSTLEAHLGGKFRRAMVLQELAAAQETLTRAELPKAVLEAKVVLEAVLSEKQEQFQKMSQIAREGEALVNSIISATEYYENRMDRVTFNFNGSRVTITMNNFPEKDVTLSTSTGTIQNVVYNSQGGVLRFTAHPTPGGNYYKFRISRVRTNIRDGRLFYQGDMDLCLAGSPCEPNSGLYRHGVVKLSTSN